MSMHLEGAWLSTTGKKKGKQKFRNAESARRARELADSWEKLKAKYEPKKKTYSTKTKQAISFMQPVPFRRETRYIESLETNGMGDCTKRAPQQYTGTSILGIATMHKSNAVPVFSQEDAKEISRMRRG